MNHPFGRNGETRSSRSGGNINPRSSNAEGDDGLAGIVRQLLGNVRVVDPGLQQAVEEASREIWPDLDRDDVAVGGYRAGTLNLLLDSHARLAEAKNFAGEGLRQRINEIIAARNQDQSSAEGLEASSGDDASKKQSHKKPNSKSLTHAKSVAGPPRKQSEGNYVTRIHFYLRGTK